MKKVVIFLILFFALPLISSEIVIVQQPNTIYNIGDSVNVPITVKAISNVQGYLRADLICNGEIRNFFMNGVNIAPGNESNYQPSLTLSKNVIGDLRGTCRIKSYIGSDFALTNDFVISDIIRMNTSLGTLEYSPNDSIQISGKAYKDNGNPANGFFGLIFYQNESTITQAGTVTNGKFSANITLPQDIRAGVYLVELRVYEQDSDGKTTNIGFFDQNVEVKHVPTSLEILFENNTKTIQPGTSLRVSSILHDQTGEKMPAKVFISVKNNYGKIVQQSQLDTEQVLEFPVTYNEPPATWKVVAASTKLTAESDFTIPENASVRIDIVNNTLFITNTGNILYNKTAQITIGSNTTSVNVYLEIGQTETYTLTAPDGKYDIHVISESSNAEANGVFLTGRAIDVKTSSSKEFSFAKYYPVWIFMVFIFVFVGIILFNKSKKNNTSFMTYSGQSSKPSKPSPPSKPSLISAAMPKAMITSEKKLPSDYEIVGSAVKGALISSRSPAEISVSIKGNQEEACMIAINIKNFMELRGKDGDGGAKESLQKIVSYAEDRRASTYQDGSSVVFILTPSTTKNSSNEKTALDIAKKANDVLSNHNRMFKQKINYGVSMVCGMIVGKQDGRLLRFTSIDNSVSSAKKISSMAESEILLSEKMNDKLKSNLKTEKNQGASVNSYRIREIKNPDQNTKFIKGFLDRLNKG